MRKAFTLVELMIVVVIIGILAAVAIPKFADMVDKSKEGATKGQLTALRGALQVYYGDNEGKFITITGASNGDIITSTFTAIMVPKYITEVAVAKLPKSGCPDSKEVYHYSPATQGSAAGGWAYDGNSTSNTWGDIRVNCTGTDLKKNPWTSY